MAADQVTNSPSNDLVVIGSSAGGVEALSILVGTLPSDFPAPIVLAQHLDPNRPSNLASILQQHTSLAVELVTTNSRLEAGKIYVVPSNHHVTIVDGHVRLQGDHVGRPRPSVDLLLSTAAAAYGERLIAVILTGSGSDGAAGSVDVKNAGGLVIVQNPETARYASMPSALPPTVVDFVTDIDRVGSLLHELLTHASLPQSGDKVQGVLPRLLDLVSRRSNIDFRAYKVSTILRRISRRMAVTRHHTIQDYVQHLEIHPEEIDVLAKALLINVTQFFRDAEVFAYLKHELLPTLVARAREHDRSLRFWSAGCATGEEPYSLAMLLADLLGPELSEWTIKIFATDLDEAAISFARRAVYPENLMEDMPPEYRDRFLERADGGYRITKDLRQLVIFGQQDLARSAPFPRLDLVLCRNLLIYFTPELQDYVLNQFAFSLCPRNGYLVLGKAEMVRSSHLYYELVSKQWKVYRCTGTVLPLARRPALRAEAMVRSAASSATRPPMVARKPDTDEEPALAVHEQVRRYNESLLRYVPVGLVVIDRSYRLLTANPAARRLLGVHDTSHEPDFLHVVRGIPYSEVRNAIDIVFHERTSITLPEMALGLVGSGTSRYLSLTIAPLQMDGSTADLAAVSVSDITEQVEIKRQLEAAQVRQAELIEQLSEANQRLTETNKELVDANEESQIVNEEMTLAQEELQATIEEFEATNEELQATNEELETTNEEQQATNEELQTTNDELKARTHELEELATRLESEAVRLTEMVKHAPFSILVLRGPTLLVEALNARFPGELEISQIQGRPFAEVVDGFWQAAAPIVDLAREVYLNDEARTTSSIATALPDAPDKAIESFFVYTIVPTHQASGEVNGVVVYAADVTEQRLREAEEERERLKLIFENAEQVALGLYDVRTTQLIIGSARYLDIIRRAHAGDLGDPIGRQWRELTVVAEGKEAEELWSRVLHVREPVRLRELHRTFVRDGRETVWDWSLTPIMDTEKPETVRYMLVSAVEITDQVQAREELERLDRLKDEFLSLASHELRTPLTPLMGYAGMLARMVSRVEDDNDPGAARMARLVQTFEKQLARLQRLVEDLVDVGRLQTGKFSLERERVDLDEVVRQAVEDAQMLSSDHRVELHMPGGDEPLVVSGDRGRLVQVVLNLLQNAITYAPQSERIDVRLSRVPAAEEQPARGDGPAGAGWAQIEVQDYGSGILAEDLPSLFTRFYQVARPDRPARGGLGLGLFISKQLVEQHGGTITVDSVAGQGSTFTVRLPLSTSQAGAGDQRPEIANTPGADS